MPERRAVATLNLTQLWGSTNANFSGSVAHIIPYSFHEFLLPLSFITALMFLVNYTRLTLSERNFHMQHIIMTSFLV